MTGQIVHFAVPGSNLYFILDVLIKDTVMGHASKTQLAVHRRFPSGVCVNGNIQGNRPIENRQTFDPLFLKAAFH